MLEQDGSRFMNPDGKQPDLDATLSDDAIDWLVKLNSGRANQADHTAFATWRRQSTQHELAAQEAETIWHGVGIAGNEVRQTARMAKVTRRAMLGGAVLLAGGVALERAGVLGPHLFADHITGIGEQRTVTLADGSSIVLNADTALSEDLGARERRLRLIKGQAVFTVAHDPARPFVVEAGDGRTRAIGTIFDIDMRPGEVVVTVLEGMVGVATDTEPSAGVTAEANQRVHYGLRGRPSSPEDVDSDIETAWRRGKLIFNRRPLGEVVADLERYRHGQIMIASNRLRSLEVTGVFDLADPEAVLRTVEETLPVRITRLPFMTIIR